MPRAKSMIDRLYAFSTDELAALLFSLDIAETVEPLTPEAEQIRQEFIDELVERDPESRSEVRLPCISNIRVKNI